MKYFYFLIISISLQSCFQCNDSYNIYKKSENPVHLYVSGGSMDKSKRVSLDFGYSKSDDTCNLIIQNTEFKFMDWYQHNINFEKELAPRFDNKTDYFKDVKDTPLDSRALPIFVMNRDSTGLTTYDHKEFMMKIDFEEKYEDLERFKLYVKTDFKDKYNRSSTQIDSFDISVTNKCHFHFLLH